jgi:hypothetical protein
MITEHAHVDVRDGRFRAVRWASLEPRAAATHQPTTAPRRGGPAMSWRLRH